MDRTTCRHYCYIRADVYGPEDIRFVSTLVCVRAERLTTTPTDDDWTLAALDQGHAAVSAPSDAVQWNDTVVEF